MTFHRLLLLLMLPLLAWAGDVEQGLLQEHYERYLDTPREMPLQVQSSETENLLAADVYGIVEQPFAAMLEALAEPGRWCEFIPLTLNIKACTFQRRDERTLLTFYAGRKHYQTPDEAFRLQYRFAIEAQDAQYLRVALAAAEGPLGTRDYRIVLEAMPVGGGSFVRVHSAHRPSLRSDLSTQTYLATLGRDKVGFTVVGRDSRGEPVYVKGVKGVIERNAVRYYLALQAFAATRQLAPEERFEARIQTWYDLTEDYPAQLREMERAEYLQAKRREWANQHRLQEALQATP